MYLVRVRVPLVRPLVRCTLKRVLRVMPSALLLLFVFSLIFVTLMQIAVIHAHRRAHYTPRHEVNATPVPHHPEPKQQLPATAATKPNPHKRPETLRVEAFLDKNAPSVEANMFILQNMASSARVRHILRILTSAEGKRSRDAVHGVSTQHVDHGSRRAQSSIPVIQRGALWAAQPTVPKQTPSFSSHRNSSSGKLLGRKPLCPSVPPRLEHRIKVDLNTRQNKDVEDLLRRSPYLRGRGAWSPPNCSARHRVAVIIPYRDREEHLAILLYTLHPLLQRQLLQYKVYVIEQFGNDTFNKGVLMNAGVREALREGDYHCFVFHDVDMIPEDDRNMYSCPQNPRHMSVAVDKFNYTLPYPLLVGGVFSIRMEHFVLVNGYSNLYWGWGGEDDDMAYRIKYRKLEIIRPPESLARYTMIKHDHRPESPNSIRTALLRMAKKRSPRDGLNTVKYKVVSKTEFLSYTHFLIDIGKHHRWQFLHGQRLVINF